MGDAEVTFSGSECLFLKILPLISDLTPYFRNLTPYFLKHLFVFLRSWMGGKKLVTIKAAGHRTRKAEELEKLKQTK